MTSWKFGPFVLDATAGALSRDGEALRVQPRVVQLLTHACERPGELLSRASLLELLWPDVVVTDHSLSQLSHRIRTHLGEHRGWWVTVPRRGYRFEAPLEEPDAPLVASSRNFHGRTAELSWLKRAVQAGTWTTVVGQGGAGKTRLVSEFFSRYRERWPWAEWIELTDVRAHGQVTEQVAAALGIELASTDRDAQVGRALAARGAGLLVLDNLEQLEPACFDAMAYWQRTATEVAWLGTSRVDSGVHGAEILHVPPLDDAACHQLFRARAAHAGVRVDGAHDAALSDIVRALGGLPLALELAAARVVVLDPPAIRDRLNRQLSLLAGGDPGRPQRHRSMVATIRWSWELLTAVDQELLVRVALFRGGVTVAMMEQTLGERSAIALDGLHRLVGHSLLQRGPAVEGDGRRLTMHPYVREFSLDRLAERDDQVAIERSFADGMVGRMEPALALLRQWQDDRRDALDADLPSAEEALLRRPQTPGLWERTVVGAHLCGRLGMAGRFVSDSADQPLGMLARVVLGTAEELPQLLTDVERCVDQLERAGSDGKASEILRILAQRALQSGDIPTGLSLAERAQAQARRSDNRALLAWAHLPIAGANLRRGTFPAALEACEAGLSLVAGASHPRLETALLDVKGRVQTLCGDFVSAERSLSEAHAAALRGHIGVRTASIEINLAGIRQSMGDLEGSQDLLLSALARFERLGFLLGVAVSHNNLALNAIHLGDYQTALEHIARAQATGAGAYVDQLLATTRSLCWLMMGRFSEMTAAIESHLSTTPDEESTAVLLALRCLAESRVDPEKSRETASILEALPLSTSRAGIREAAATCVAFVRDEPLPRMDRFIALEHTLRRFIVEAGISDRP